MNRISHNSIFQMAVLLFSTIYTVTMLHILEETSRTLLLTYLLTNWFAASQEIPRISRNPKVQFCTHKRPPPVSILGQPNPVHIPTSHLLEIHLNTIHPSTPRSPQWSPSLLCYLLTYLLTYLLHGAESFLRS